MITPQEYRRMAEECFGWAREAQTDEVRQCYLNLAQTWVDAASWIDRASGQRSSAHMPAMRRSASARKAA
jgi:hypothetical protein